MRVNMLTVLLIVTIKLIASTTLKQFFFRRAPKQSVFMNNQANSNSNAMAVNTGILGDANAFSGSNASNVNFINQHAQPNQPTE